MRRPHLARPVAAVLLSLALLGCAGGAGEDEPGVAAPSESSSETAEPPTEDEQESTGDGSGDNAGTIAITFSGDSVEPAGQRVEVEVDSEVVLEITADAPGSLHVHTSPEQEIRYGKGTTSAAVAVDQPGVIEVESHDLGIVVLQLEAR